MQDCQEWVDEKNMQPVRLKQQRVLREFIGSGLSLKGVGKYVWAPESWFEFILIVNLRYFLDVSPRLVSASPTY